MIYEIKKSVSWTLLKFKSSGQWKILLMKRHATECEKIFAKHIYNKEFVYKIYKEHINSTIRN